ncbi:TTF-type domain-containing protein [Trichonephila clavipes]|nr:TTF-type domain-containing protein [Trichonephila clavipes]
MSRSVGGVQKLGEEDSRSDVVLVTCPWLKITKTINIVEFHNENLSQNVNSSESEEAAIELIENLDVDVENSLGTSVIPHNEDFDFESNHPTTSNGFQSIDDTTGQGLCKFINGLLNSLGLNLSDVRGQSYGNGANMRGKYKGLEQKNIENNPRALNILCSAHSLNLVVNDAAKISFETFNFFGAVQELYNYFSSPVKRRSIL